MQTIKAYAIVQKNKNGEYKIKNEWRENQPCVFKSKARAGYWYEIMFKKNWELKEVEIRIKQ